MPACKVFISYSHDSAEHEQRVLTLAQRLRHYGVDAYLDQYVGGTPEEGWPRWMLDRLDWADFVLVVCTQTYYRRFRGHEKPGKGKGADWEGNLITLEMYNNKSRTTKFAPVLFDLQDEQFIPDPISGHTHYLLDSDENYAKLYAFLTGKAGVPPRRLGSLKVPAHKPVKSLTFQVSGTSAPPLRKIFLSSSTGGLAECCAALARDLALEGWQCVSMEDSNASDAASVEYRQKRVQECDVYVGIIGTLYGGRPPTSQKSFTEIEYEAAVTKDMPRLIFLTSEDFWIPTDPPESDTNRELQRKLRHRLGQERKAKFFDAPKDLKAVVIDSLALLEETVEAPRPFSDELNAEPNLGLSVHRLCDRGVQEDAFSEFFRRKIQEMPRLPHIYILRGEECENLDSLIDRFCKITIERQLIPQLNLPRGPVAWRLVEWPDPDSPHPEEALARRLFLKIAEDEDYPTLDAARFVNLRLLTVSGMLALRHEIREKRWTTKVLRLIDWYCRFWDEVAAHHPMRQLMIFISILYPDGTKEHGWKALLPFSVAFGRVERDLVELQNRRQRETERNPRMCPIKRLPEVCCVRESHLMEWFSTQHICELYERERYREHLFANRDCVHMAHLEPELKKIVINWREKRYEV